MSNKSVISVEERQDAFLKVYPTAGTIKSAAEAIGVNRRTVHTWFKTHPEFSERFEQARQGFVEELENIAYSLVKEMADNRDYKANPTLLIFLLNGNAPEKYKGISDTSAEARDVLSEFRKMARATVVTDKKPEKKLNMAQQSVLKYEEEKKALAEKFGSLKNGNPNSD